MNPICMIAAIDLNNAIGYDNKLLFHNRKDMEWFKLLTSGHTVIMGNNTFKSLGKPLPNRRNIVITKNSQLLSQNYTSPKDNLKEFKYSTLEDAIQEAQYLKHSSQYVFIIGGESIYKEFIKYSDYLFITKINKSFEFVDAYFPIIDSNEFELLWESTDLFDTKQKCTFKFSQYVKLL